MQYRWNCGAGQGIVKIDQARINDGKWHRIKVSRRGRHCKLTLDELSMDGVSPVGSHVINLYRDATRLRFGASVVDDTIRGAGRERIENGLYLFIR